MTKQISIQKTLSFKTVRMHTDCSIDKTTTLDSLITIDLLRKDNKLTILATEELTLTPGSQQHQFVHDSHGAYLYSNLSPCLESSMSFGRLTYEKSQFQLNFLCDKDNYKMTLTLDKIGKTLWEWEIVGPYKNQRVKLLLEDNGQFFNLLKDPFL